MAEAIGGVIVHHAGRLHKGIADRRADKAEAALLQRLAHGIRFFAARRNLLVVAPTVDQWLATDELPYVLGEATEVLLDRQKGARVADRRFNLEPVAHDPGIGEQCFDFLRAVGGNLDRVEVVEGRAKTFAFSEDDLPAETRLHRVQHEKLEQLAVVPEWNAPLAVVVLDGQFTAWPSASSPVRRALGFCGPTGAPRAHSSVPGENVSFVFPYCSSHAPLLRDGCGGSRKFCPRTVASRDCSSRPRRAPVRLCTPPTSEPLANRTWPQFQPRRSRR